MAGQGGVQMCMRGCNAFLPGLEDELRGTMKRVRCVICDAPKSESYGGGSD
jgi:hypothetical protein